MTISTFLNMSPWNLDMNFIQLFLFMGIFFHFYSFDEIKVNIILGIF